MKWPLVLLISPRLSTIRPALNDNTSVDDRAVTVSESGDFVRLTALPCRLQWCRHVANSRQCEKIQEPQPHVFCWNRTLTRHVIMMLRCSCRHIEPCVVCASSGRNVRTLELVNREWRKCREWRKIELELQCLLLLGELGWPLPGSWDYMWINVKKTSIEVLHFCKGITHLKRQKLLG